jgi:hypothetical protein
MHETVADRLIQTSEQPDSSGAPPQADQTSLCPAELYIADDFGDNEATVRCQLELGHSGQHKEEWARDGGVQKCCITWTVDEKATRGIAMEEYRRSVAYQDDGEPC